MQLLRTQKITQPLGTIKLMQLLRTTKKSRILWDKQKSRNILEQKNHGTSQEKNHATSQEKKSHNLSGQKYHAKSRNLLGRQKITQPLGQNKSCNLSGLKKIMGALKTQKITVSIGSIASKLVHKRH